MARWAFMTDEGKARKLAKRYGVDVQDIVEAINLGWSLDDLNDHVDANGLNSILETGSGTQSAIGMSILGTTPEGGRASGDRPLSGYEDIRTMVGEVPVYTPPPPTFTPEGPADSVEYDPDAPDILEQMYERWDEGFDPLAQERIGAANEYALGLNALADQYGDSVRGSDGYTDLGRYRDEHQAIYDAGGLTDVTRSNLEKSRREEDQWIRAQREAMLSDLAERGMSGGGAEIAASIGDRAAAADRMSARDLETHAFAQQQALEALGKAGEYSKDLFDIDQDLATKKLGYQTQGLDEAYSIVGEMNDTGMQAWEKIYGDFLKNRGDAWHTARDGVVPASNSTVETLSNETDDAQGDVEDVISHDVDSNNNWGGGLTGTVGTTTPLNTASPPLGGSTGAGAAGEAGLATGGQILGNLIGNLTSGGEEEEEDK